MSGDFYCSSIMWPGKEGFPPSWPLVSLLCKKMAQRFQSPLLSLVPHGIQVHLKRKSRNGDRRSITDKLVSFQRDPGPLVVMLLGGCYLSRNEKHQLPSLALSSIDHLFLPSVPLELYCLLWLPPAACGFSTVLKMNWIYDQFLSHSTPFQVLSGHGY